MAAAPLLKTLYGAKTNTVKPVLSGHPWDLH